MRTKNVLWGSQLHTSDLAPGAQVSRLTAQGSTIFLGCWWKNICSEGRASSSHQIPMAPHDSIISANLPLPGKNAISFWRENKNRKTHVVSSFHQSGFGNNVLIVCGGKNLELKGFSDTQPQYFVGIASASYARKSVESS